MSDDEGHLPGDADPLAIAGVPEAEVRRVEAEPTMRQYLVDKLEAEAQRHWDVFYKTNTTRFFKDRHWLGREFGELVAGDAEHRTLLEVGCGVGNTVFPLLEENGGLFVHCCDFSPRAVAFVQAHEDYDPERCRAFQCDLAKGGLPAAMEGHPPVDMVTMLFVLSAMAPGTFAAALRSVAAVVRPGGVVLFRDYGLWDHAMLRFKRGRKLGEAFYVRHDGTRAYYFRTEELAALFAEAGFEAVDCIYVRKETSNRAKGLTVPRVFVQGRFRRV